MNHKHIRVTFFQVKNDQHKRSQIVKVAHDYFEKKEPLLLKLPHEKALEYVDLLLWKFPSESFLPHVIKDTPCTDLIVLTTSDQNPNQARSVFNLCPQPIANPKLYFYRIYELEDLSSTQKNKTAQERYKTYREQGYTIVSQPIG